MTLHTRIHGAGHAHTIVLLHAIATSGAMWEPQIDRLSTSFRVVTVDLPGHGASPALPPGSDLGAYADAVLQTLDEHGVTSFTVVGESLGAMVSVRIAARRPRAVTRVILACCGTHTTPKAAEIWRERVADVERAGIASQIETSVERWFTPTFIAAHSPEVDRIRRMIGATPDAGFISAATAISTMDHRDLLPHIVSPTLVVSGRFDTAVSADATAELHAGIAGASHRSIDAAHLLSVEAPDDFTGLVENFAGAR